MPRVTELDTGLDLFYQRKSFTGESGVPSEGGFIEAWWRTGTLTPGQLRWGAAVQALGAAEAPTPQAGLSREPELQGVCSPLCRIVKKVALVLPGHVYLRLIKPIVVC